MALNFSPRRLNTWQTVAAIALVCLVTTGSSAAPQEAPRLDLDVFLESVRERHPFFENQELAIYIEALGRDGLLGGQDWTLQAYIQTAQQHQPGAVFSPERVNQSTAGISVQRAFWQSGGRLSVNWNMGHTRSRISLPEPFSSSPVGLYDNQFGIFYSQPLRRNAGGFLDRTPYETSKISVAIAALQAEEDKETFLLELAMRFVAWASLSEQYDVTRERFKLAKRQYDRVQDKHRSYLVDKIDVLRAADAVRATEARVRLIKSQRDAAGAELAVLAQDDNLLRLQPAYDFESRSSVPALGDASRLLRRPVRVLEAFELRRRMAQREYQALLEEKKPDLSLRIGVSRVGGGQSERDLLNVNKQDYSVGLQLTVPLGNRIATARANQGSARVRQIELLSQQTALELEALLQNLLVQLTELNKVITIDDLQIASARAKTAEEIEQYNQGRSDLTFVIQAQDAVQDARLLRIRNATTYHQLSLQLDGLLDRLLPAQARRSNSHNGGAS